MGKNNIVDNTQLNIILGTHANHCRWIASLSLDSYAWCISSYGMIFRSKLNGDLNDLSITRDKHQVVIKGGGLL